MKRILLKALIPLIVVTVTEIRAENINELFNEVEIKKTSYPALAQEKLKQIRQQKDELLKQEEELLVFYEAHFLILKSDYKKAKDLLLNLANNTDHQPLLARTYSLISTILLFTGEYTEAFKYSKKALILLDEIKDNDLHKFAVVQNIASIFKQSELFNQAMEYSRQLVRLADIEESPLKLCISNYELASWEMQVLQTQMAKERIEKSITNCRQAQERLFLALATELKAKYFLVNNQPEEAVKILQAQQSEVEDINYQALRNVYDIRLAETYLTLEKYDLSLKHAKTAYNRAKRQDDILRLMEASKILADIYSKQKQLKKSVDFYKEYMQLEQQKDTQLNQRKMAYFLVSLAN